MRRTATRILALLSVLVGVVPLARAEPPKDLRAAAIEALRKSLSDPDRGVRYAATQALGKAGEAPTVFAGPLRDPEWCVRQEAAWWCRKAGAAAAPVLGEVIANGTLEQKVSATWALSGLGEAAVPLLRRALASEETEMRVEAIAATRRLGLPAGKPLIDALLPSLKAESLDERLEAALALVTLRPGDAEAAVPALVEGFARRDRWEACVDALFRAGTAGEAAIGQLVLDEQQQKHVDAKRRFLSEERYLREQAEESPPSPAPVPPSEPVAPLAPPARPPAPPPFDPTALRSASVFDRIDAALEVGRRGEDAAHLAPLVRDPERDVRVAAAMGLGHAVGDADADAALLEAARDPRWQVQLAAVRSLGRRRAHPEIVAPFLRDPVLALSDAAHTALARMGAAAALPTAQQVATAHYGALHYAPTFFETLGTDGAAAVPVLAGLLAHHDVNVRETAARCLRPIGGAARDAIPALCRALGDDRLCVINHVALALGRTGLSEAMLGALADPRARVRAYATLALGWALGEAAHVDQVPFEVRLPVLDVGDAGPFPSSSELDAAIAIPAEDTPPAVRAPAAALLRRAIHSKDPAIAVRAAGALDEKELDVRDAERVMELLLPTGLRPGWPGDFGALHSIIGSAELPACMMYVMRARVTDPDTSEIYGNFHRISRADTIPALLWFERVEEPDARQGTFELWMPFDRTAAYLRERASTWLRRDPGDAPGAAARAYVHDFLEHPEAPPDRPMLWALRDLDPTPADVPLLLRAATADRALREAGLARPGWAAPALVGLLWVLARCSDLETEAFLRDVATVDDHPESKIALAALARRGDPEALSSLIEEIGQNEEALPLLVASAPGPATRALARRLLDPALESSLFDLQDDWLDMAGQLGAIPLDEAFLGLEAAIAESPLKGGIGPVVRGRIAVTFPGCATRRLAEQVLTGFEAPGAAPSFDRDGTWPHVLEDETGLRIVAFLRTADPTRTDRLLRRWAAGEEIGLRRFASNTLVGLADREGAPLVVAFERSLSPKGKRPLREPWRLGRVGGPDAVAYLRELADDPRTGPEERDAALCALARASGWPTDAPLAIKDFGAVVQDQVRAALRRGDFDAVRALGPETESLVDGLPISTPVWKRLGHQALRGDARARAEFWSAQRTARYRWLHHETDPLLHTLGRDPSTLPHWLSDLDSNCCRVSDGLSQEVFEQPFGMPNLYGTEAQGVAMPLSERARLWLRWTGGRFVFGPLGREAWDGDDGWGFVPQAE